MVYVDKGTILHGKYRLDELIGRGGMGSVWRAEHLGLNAPVAVKVLDVVGSTLTRDLLERFRREARAAANIRSPHVVQILDHGFDESINVPFIVMELMEGQSLAQRVEQGPRLAAAEVAHVFTHIARALTRVHEAGIVHRDLKPDNVFLVQNEDEIVAKVLDFGIAKANVHGLLGDSATRTGAMMGTPYYMSPEQISGAKNVDFRTDLWALGVMACECLTGRRPFEADTIGGLTLKICIEPLPMPSSFATVSPGFDAWFVRCVHRDPAQRFSSAREAADNLRQVLATPGNGLQYSAPDFDAAQAFSGTNPQRPRSFRAPAESERDWASQKTAALARGDSASANFGSLNTQSRNLPQGLETGVPVSSSDGAAFQRKTPSISWIIGAGVATTVLAVLGWRALTSSNESATGVVATVSAVASLAPSVVTPSVVTPSVEERSVEERSVVERSVVERSVVERSVVERSVVEPSVAEPSLIAPVVLVPPIEAKLAASAALAAVVSTVTAPPQTGTTAVAPFVQPALRAPLPRHVANPQPAKPTPRPAQTSSRARTEATLQAAKVPDVVPKRAPVRDVIDDRH